MQVLISLGASQPLICCDLFTWWPAAIQCNAPCTHTWINTHTSTRSLRGAQEKSLQVVTDIWTPQHCFMTTLQRTCCILLWAIYLQWQQTFQHPLLNMTTTLSDMEWDSGDWKGLVFLEKPLFQTFALPPCTALNKQNPFASAFDLAEAVSLIDLEVISTYLPNGMCK